MMNMIYHSSKCWITYYGIKKIAKETKMNWEEQSSHVSFMAGNIQICYNKYAPVQCASANKITFGGFLTRLFFLLRRLCGAFSGKRALRGISAVTLTTLAVQNVFQISLGSRVRVSYDPVWSY